jgi:catechol-2,3-dioxygenase
MAERMAIKQARLGHVVLNVRDLKKSERFYRDILGMKVSGRNLITKMSFLSFGSEHHDVALQEVRSKRARIPRHKVSPLHHFSVYVPTPREVDALVPVLKRRHIRIVSGPEILEVARNRSVSFLDPDGNRVEVACNRHKFGYEAPRG